MKKNRRFSRVLAMLMAAFVVTTSVFANEMTVEAASKKPTVTLSATKGTIAVGKSTTIKIKKASNKASKKIKDYKFKTSNNKVATVNSKGKITGKKAGSATITMTSKKKVSGKKVTAKYKVTVVKVLSKSISTAKSITVVQGKTTNLKATVIPANADNRGVTYASKNKKVATVNSKGKVKGVKAGKTKITITAKDGKAKATVSVKVIKKNSKDAKKLASKVSFKTSKVTLTEGQTYTQKATVKTKGKNKTVYYQSSNAKVATVDAKSGKVKAVAKGKATITAYATDGSNKSGKYTVTVNPKPQPQPPAPTPEPQVIPVTGVTISGAPTEAVKANAFAPIQLTAIVAPADATDKTVTWSVSADSCVTVDNKGLVTLNPNYSVNNVDTEDAVVTATAGGKSASVTIAVIYSEIVTIAGDGTKYEVSLDKSAEGYAVTRGGETKAVDTDEFEADLANLAERLGNWDGKVDTLQAKINAHWGDEEGAILDLLNGFSMVIGDQIDGEVEIAFNNNVYTITRGERLITVARNQADFTFTITEGDRVVTISNITSEINEDGEYIINATVTKGDKEKDVTMSIATTNGVVSHIVVTTNNGATPVCSFVSAANTYDFMLNKTYYDELGEDFMSDLTIVQNYK